MAFGESAQIYNSARKEYSAEIISKINQCIIKDVNCNNKILDLGCGTGIASRQLLQTLSQATIWACDIDPDMISIAQKIGGNIKYHVMPTNKLDIISSSVNAITAFGSFHWFCDPVSIAEIKRVLRPNGTLFIVNKDNDTFKQEIYPIISKYCDPTAINSKSNYNPRLILENNGFVEVNEYVCEAEETYNNIDELLEFIQSLKFWESVAPDNKNTLLADLRESLTCRFFKNKGYTKKVVTSLVWAKKIIDRDLL
jgi:ubiquinone/menaquinone biosynthesis C-methylase UbiE